MSVFVKIQDHLEKLSNAKKKVAYFILDNWQEVALLSASELSKRVGVSESVVVRFAQDIGFKGYPDLQSDLKKVFQNRFEHKVQKGFSSEENCQDNSMYHHVYQQAMYNIQQTLNHNSDEILNLSAKTIHSARKIVIMARRNSLGPAKILQVHLNEAYGNVLLISGENDEVFDYLRGMNKEDLLITISVPSYSKRMVHAVQFAKEREITQICLSNLNNPFREIVDINLLTSINSDIFANSHMATVFLIEILLGEIFEINKVEVLKSLEDMEKVNQRFGISQGVER
ncbi:DNA-binding MurR/RpiR family transcriptional regulator [Bacillus pakistanensis]|uniref:DNA-binding MurR/RpiR family transcriptional regulator n=1 Tax=Rossellomorea pakistanensis TaxID=992288 RepID=A0ABS2NHM2_9BACI|nr:MurR/RpiR family transcriptional regulator [Bacillus pakistanensis]MBM7587305.1 DNA-binding MurR/RpiR family transcriptional regulator [Bacillus pakistanensis]